MLFSPYLSYTTAERGSQTVTIAKPNLSQRCTVMVGGSLEGEQLPPFLIFKGKDNGQIQEYCKRPEKQGGTDFTAELRRRHGWMKQVL